MNWRWLPARPGPRQDRESHHRISTTCLADVEIERGDGEPERIAVPVSALIDSGARQAVILDKGEGRFEPRPVRTGMRGNGYVEIKEGVSEGEKAVTAANFLIDAESNLRAALHSFTARSPQETPTQILRVERAP